jgi:hypothetical protein
MSNTITYESRFTASNMASPVIMELRDNMNSITVSIEEAGEAADKTSQSFRGLSSESELFCERGRKVPDVINQNASAMRGLQRSLFGVQMALFTSSILISNMMAIETATNQVETAQQRLNTMQREGKRGTDEYRNAVRQLETAQINLNRAQTMTSIMTASVGLQMVSMGLGFAQAIPDIRKMIDTLKTYNLVATISKALTPGVGWAALAVGGGLAVAGAVALNSAYSQGSGKSSTSIDINVNNDDIIQAYLQRTGGNHTKTMGVS